MKTRIIVLIFSVVLLLAGTVSGQVQNSPGSERGRIERYRQGNNGPMALGKESVFTVEQREAVKAIRMKTFKELKPLKDKLREMMAHHESLVTAEKADLNAINASIDKMSETKTAIAKIMAREHQEIRALLSEEQRIRFDQMKPGRPERMGRGQAGVPVMPIHRGGNFRGR